MSRVHARALPLIDLLVRDRHATKLDSTPVRELVQRSATDVERVPPRRVNREDVDALAGLGVRELPAGSAVRGVEGRGERAADVREGGEAGERRESCGTPSVTGSRGHEETKRTLRDEAILPGRAGNAVQVAIGVVVGLVKTDRGLRDGVGGSRDGVGGDSSSEKGDDCEELHVENEVGKVVKGY